MVEPAQSVEMRHFKDPIHDYITVSPLMSSIIDTPQFQRLRYIKQLGITYRVWPGASHNRFEHGLGVAHLARCLVEHLRVWQPALGITLRDVICVQIAALCHDLGHGPFSHLWDGHFIAVMAPEKNWRHEDASKMMFKFLLKDNKIALPEADVNFILALIDGDHDECPEEKRFLFDIVANKRNGIDVDKVFDYISRDTFMTGDAHRVPAARLINSARVINNGICYNIKDVNVVFDICQTRFKLHKMIYNHKTARQIEYMIVDALILAEPYLKIVERVDIPEKYLYLTDNIMQQIQSSQAPELQQPKALFDRIDKRDLYKRVDYCIVSWADREIVKRYVTSERIVEEACRLAVEKNLDTDLSEFSAECVIVDHTMMHYGMKEKNPLDSIKFYSKRNLNECALARRSDYSVIMPEHFAEVTLTVITKLPKYYGVIQGGFRSVIRSIPGTSTPLEPEPEREDDDEPPTTPKHGPSQPSGLASIPDSPFYMVSLDFAPPTPRSSQESLKRSHGDVFGDDEERETKRQAQ